MATEGPTMSLIYGLLILAMIFFFVLPITDARTARMKASVVGSLGVLLAVCAVGARLIRCPFSPPRCRPAPAGRRDGGTHDSGNGQYCRARGHFRRRTPLLPGACRAFPQGAGLHLA